MNRNFIWILSLNEEEEQKNHFLLLYSVRWNISISIYDIRYTNGETKSLPTADARLCETVPVVIFIYTGRKGDWEKKK